jgi:N-methylhydantoinase A/oxoprolinase/acetone carboxylase beta subunit
MYRIGIDVGGTFTDLVAVDDFGGAILAKVPSTPADSSVGVLDGLRLLADLLDLELAALLAQTDRIVHGTTVATNALLERKGARVGLLTTEGHRDVIEMREGRSRLLFANKRAVARIDTTTGEIGCHDEGDAVVNKIARLRMDFAVVPIHRTIKKTLIDELAHGRRAPLTRHTQAP